MVTQRPVWFGRVVVFVALALMMVLSLLPAGTPAAGASGTTLRLRAVHAVPDFGAVDVYVGRERVLAGVTFFAVSPYLELTASHINVRVFPAGANPTRSRPIVNQNLDLVQGRDYTLVVRGSVAASNVGATLLQDDNSRPVAGEAKLRVAHFSPDAPAVDVFINGERSAVRGLAFRNTTGYLGVPPGTYQVGIAPAGDTPIFTTSVTLEAGKVYTAWANGLLTPPADAPAQAFKVTPSVDAEFALARVRAVHAIAALAGSPVDVYVNGQRAVTFDFFTVTPYLPVYAGTLDVRVTPAGGNPETQAVIQANVPVQAGQDYSIVARIKDGAPGATVLQDDNSRPAAGEARLRAAHFSADAPAVDIFINGERSAVRGLAYDTATGYLGVPAGTYAVGIAPAGSTPIFTTSVTLEAGKVYTAWANGLLTPPADAPAQAFKVTPSVDAEFDVARVRLLHAVPGAPAVDIFVGGTQVAAGVRFGDLSSYLALFAGETTVEVRAAGTSEVLLTGSVRLAAGQTYTAAVASAESGPAALELLLFNDDTVPPASGQSKVRAVHLAPGAPAVDVRSGDAALISGLAFGQNSTFVVEAGLRELRVTLAGGGATLLSTRLNLAAGGNSTVFVLGRPGEAPEGQELRTVIASNLAANAPAATFSVYLPLVVR